MTPFAVSRTTPLADLPEFLRVDECADVLGVGRGLVYGMVKSGELPSVRFGRLVRVPRAGLVAKVNAFAADRGRSDE
jgi:excisionase family DNA binding protein